MSLHKDITVISSLNEWFYQVFINLYDVLGVGLCLKGRGSHFS